MKSDIISMFKLYFCITFIWVDHTKTTRMELGDIQNINIGSEKDSFA
jgi:hypothetical protein